MNLQYLLCLSTAFLESLFFSGVVFGWPFLQFVLQEEGYFSENCHNKSDIENRTTKDDALLTCYSQESRLNLVFTLATSFLSVSTLASGYILDHYGTWLFRTIMGIFFTLGYALLAASTVNHYLIFPGMILLAVSGIGLLMSNFQVANLYKAFRGMILTFLNGLFDSAVLVFFLVKVTYESGISLQYSFIVLTCISVTLWLRTFLVMPKRKISYPLPPKQIMLGWKNCKNNSSVENNNAENVKPKEIRETCSITTVEIPQNNSNSTSCDNKEIKTNFADSFKKGIFWTNLFHFVTIVFRVFFYLGSFLTWLNSFEGKLRVSNLTNIFGVILMFGALVSPLNGMLLDSINNFLKTKVKNEKIRKLYSSSASMTVTSFSNILLCLMTVFHYPFASMVFLLITRSFVFGGSSAFIVMSFPVAHCGKLFGVTNLTVGFINLLQFALFEIAESFDPTFYYLNIGFLILSISSLIHPIFIYREAKKFYKLNAVQLT